MRRLSDIHWPSWTPQIRSTLLFVQRGQELLLMRKKRGLGAGKINAPGGKIDPGETPLECALRELWEEVGVRAGPTRYRGELYFQFTDGLALHVEVFTAEGCEGEPVETDEAAPMWVHVDHIPYDEMWADDRVWVPAMLADQGFLLRALFREDEMLDHHLVLRPL